ncbi:MAG: hypothetical protein ACOYCE_02750 [Limnochordia bacterium]
MTQLSLQSAVPTIIMGLIAAGAGLLFARYLTAPVRKIASLLAGLGQGAPPR